MHIHVCYIEIRWGRQLKNARQHQRIWIHYAAVYNTTCVYTSQIRVGSALIMEVISTAFSTRIPNSQSKLVTDNALKCILTHLPVYRSIQLIYQRVSTQLCIEMHCCNVNQNRNEKRSLKRILKLNNKLR